MNSEWFGCVTASQAGAVRSEEDVAHLLGAIDEARDRVPASAGSITATWPDSSGCFGGKAA